jgi:hypothetical protein
MANRVYSGYWEKTIAAAALFTAAFDIDSANREMKIKNIFWSLNITDSATGKRVDWMTTTDHLYSLYIFANAAAMPFTYVSGQTFSDNGNYLITWNPGQIFFDSFFIKNNLSAQLNIRNKSAGQVMYDTSVIIETEENIIYQ